jgi:nucleotidyltransferase substrate binding protein (TIGR01987 family)
MAKLLHESLTQWATAILRLDEALKQSPQSNPLAIDGTIQRFEFCFDLGWKTMKRALEVQGLQEKTPREVFKAAFKLGWLSEGDTFWMQMLEDRNRTSHTYDAPTADEVYSRIKGYHQAYQRLSQVLQRLG